MLIIMTCELRGENCKVIVWFCQNFFRVGQNSLRGGFRKFQRALR